MGASRSYYSSATTVKLAPGGDSGEIGTSLWKACAIDINITALAGTITFVFSRIAADGLPYPIWTSGAVAATGAFSVHLSEDMMGTYAAGSQPVQGVIFTTKGLLSWTIATSATFSVSVEGQS